MGSDRQEDPLILMDTTPVDGVPTLNGYMIILKRERAEDEIVRCKNGRALDLFLRGFVQGRG